MFVSKGFCRRIEIHNFFKIGLHHIAVQANEEDTIERCPRGKTLDMSSDKYKGDQSLAIDNVSSRLP